MNFSNAAFDQADRLAESERQAGIDRARAALEGTGRLVCDCGQPISEARRKAMPSAADCIDCATFKARQHRKRA